VPVDGWMDLCLGGRVREWVWGVKWVDAQLRVWMTLRNVNVTE
jgi:hypothetical protein